MKKRKQRRRQKIPEQFAPIDSLFDKYSPAYKCEQPELDAMLDREHFLHKSSMPEAENSQYDLPRLIYIDKIIDFILKYYITKRETLLESLSMAELVKYELFVLYNARELLCRIGYLVANLSNKVRSDYQTLLGPAPFTWKTFEYFAALMKLRQVDQVLFFFKASDREIIGDFIDEVLSEELVIEAAINDIMRDDLPQLKNLIQQIIAKLKLEKKDPITSAKLIAIKVLTTRIMDGRHLTELLSLTNDSYSESDIQALLNETNEAVNNGAYQTAVVAGMQRQFDVTTKIGKHAALRRLQKIGELVTGKNLSARVLKLDPSVDWQALITIRDNICHQDTAKNKSVIDALLQNEQFMLQLQREIIGELYPNLNNLINRRTAQPLRFTGDAVQFWNKLYHFAKNEPTKVEVSVPVSKWRVNTEEAKIFLDALKQIGASLEVQLVWLNIFNGRTPIPQRKEYGRLLSELLLKKTNKELYDKCKSIAKQATNPRTTLINRNAERQQLEQDKKQKELKRHNELQGLRNLRYLAQLFNISERSVLSRVQMVAAAIAALENIKEFLEQDEFICANFDFPSIDAWFAAQPKYAGVTFYARLCSNPEFSEAIEYNAGQLLQFIRVICAYDETRAFSFINTHFESLIFLRNYIEHGNYLTDTEYYDTKSEKSLITKRQKIIGPAMMTLIFKLLPELKELKSQLSIQEAQQFFRQLPFFKEARQQESQTAAELHF